MALVQSTYEVYPDRGYPGSLARPTEPHALDGGVIHVPSGANVRRPRPGDAVYYDETENAFALPTTAAQSRAVVGILSYRADTVQTATTHLTQFEDGAEVEVAVHGTFWVTAGSALEYGQLLVWDRADFQWDPAAGIPTTPVTAAGTFNAASVNAALAALKAQFVDNLYRFPITCVSRVAVAAGEVAEARIGFGRGL